MQRYIGTRRQTSLLPIFSKGGGGGRVSVHRLKQAEPVIQHCRKTLHSRTKENHLVIQIQKAFWRKVRPLFSYNKKLYASKEVKIRNTCA